MHLPFETIVSAALDQVSGGRNYWLSGSMNVRTVGATWKDGALEQRLSNGAVSHHARDGMPLVTHLPDNYFGSR